MRPLILKMSISVDGFVGGPNGEIDWIFRSLDGAAAAWEVETLWKAGAHLMGSRTFRDMAAYWPASTEPFAPPMNETPKVVFSRTGSIAVALTTRALEDATHVRDASSAPVSAETARSWSNPTVASGDVGEEIARLKQQDGKPLMAHGGARFAQSLVRHGLVDKYHLLIHPVVLGRGLALFSELEEPRDLTPLRTITFESGAVARVYRPA
jgi:dihydrofolate reductase